MSTEPADYGKVLLRAEQMIAYAIKHGVPTPKVVPMLRELVAAVSALHIRVVRPSCPHCQCNCTECVRCGEAKE